MSWMAYTEAELANEPWFSADHANNVVDRLPKLAVDSKLEPPCPGYMDGPGFCGGQRYSSVGLPRVAWCAKCGRVWDWQGRPLGAQTQYIDCVPTTDAETDELHAAVKKIPQKAYEELRALSFEVRSVRLGEVLAPVIARIQERRKAAGIPLWKETVA